MPTPDFHCQAAESKLKENQEWVLKGLEASGSDLTAEESMFIGQMSVHQL